MKKMHSFYEKVQKLHTILSLLARAESHGLTWLQRKLRNKVIPGGHVLS